MTPRRPPSSHGNLDALAPQQPATPWDAAVLAGGTRDAPGRSRDDRTQSSPQRTAMIAKDLFTPKDFRRIGTKILRDHGAGRVIPPGGAAGGRPGQRRPAGTDITGPRSPSAPGRLRDGPGLLRDGPGLRNDVGRPQARTAASNRQLAWGWLRRGPGALAEPAGSRLAAASPLGPAGRAAGRFLSEGFGAAGHNAVSALARSPVAPNLLARRATALGGP